MEWPAGLTDSDKEWLLDNLELATSPLEEDVDGTTVQATYMRTMQEEVLPYGATWDLVSDLPSWLAYGLEGDLPNWAEWCRLYQEGYAESEDPKKFTFCVNALRELKRIEEQARERWWTKTTGGEPERSGMYELQPSVRQRSLVRQPSKQREVYTYRNWAGTVRRDVVR